MADEIVDEPELDYKYVIGIDPGGTTGVAALRYTDDTQPELIYLHQIADGKAGFKTFFGGSIPDDRVAIVSEKWVERENVHGANHEPLIIEGVQYAIWDDDVTYQESKMKALIKDEWLKEQNLWTPGKRHQMDALIHALVYLRNNDHQPTQEALAGDAEETIAQEGEAEAKQMPSEQPAEADPTGELAKQVAELLEAMQELSEAAEVPSDADADSDGGGQPVDAKPGDGDNGTGRADQQFPDEDYNPPEPVVKGERKRRERNGVFAGFETDNEGVEKELYSD